LKGLKYVLQSRITNSDTQDVLREIGDSMSLEKHPNQWPGWSFSTDTEAGQALLGTPDAQGAAYLLIQHKDALGHKLIDKITIFWEDRLSPVMVLYIKDV
jgi:hypothetical protein